MSIDPYAPPQHDATAEAPRSAATPMDPDEAAIIAQRLKELNTRSLAIGGAGLVLQVAGAFTPDVGTLLRLLGTVLLVIGLSMYARMRGHSPWLGLIGLLSCLGMLVLVLLPKRCFNCTARIKQGPCSNCGAPAPP